MGYPLGLVVVRDEGTTYGYGGAGEYRYLDEDRRQLLACLHQVPYSISST